MGRLGVGMCCEFIFGDRLYGYVCPLSIHHYGVHNNEAGAGSARPIVVEASDGRLHSSGAGASGARSTVVDSIMVDGKAANIAIRPIPNDSLTTYTHSKFQLYVYENIRTLCQRSCSWKNKLIGQ